MAPSNSVGGGFLDSLLKSLKSKFLGSFGAKQPDFEKSINTNYAQGGFRADQDTYDMMIENVGKGETSVFSLGHRFNNIYYTSHVYSSIGINTSKSSNKLLINQYNTQTKHKSTYMGTHETEVSITKGDITIGGDATYGLTLDSLTDFKGSILLGMYDSYAGTKADSQKNSSIKATLPLNENSETILDITSIEAYEFLSTRFTSEFVNVEGNGVASSNRLFEQQTSFSLNGDVNTLPSNDKPDSLRYSDKVGFTDGSDDGSFSKDSKASRLRKFHQSFAIQQNLIHQ